MERVTDLSELSGLTHDRYSNQLYISDRNKHCVRVVGMSRMESRVQEIVERKRHDRNTVASLIAVQVQSRRLERHGRL